MPIVDQTLFPMKSENPLNVFYNVPSNSVGDANEAILVLSNQSFYQKVNGVWTLAYSLTGGVAGNVTSVAGRVGDVTLVKADVGLSNLDNTSDLNKPVSTAQATAIANAAGTGPVTSVVGRTGAITLVKADVGLGNVDNTSDANKPVSAAQAAAISAATGAVTSVSGRTGVVTLTKTDVGLSSVDNTSDINKPVSTAQAAAIAAASGAVTSVASKTGAVTLVKGDVGLPNVDNTSDVNKPVSTAQATAIAAAAAAGAVSSVAGRTGAITLTATDVGLANVNNTSDANKPVSTAQAAAIAAAPGSVTSVATRTGAITLTSADVGLGSVNNTSDANKPVSTAQAAAIAAATGAVTSVAGRTGAVALTATDVGLANVNNTSDANKPVSTAQATSIAAAAATGPVTSVATRTGAITLTATDVGLANVTNTSDANKPVSTAQATAIALKANQNGPVTFTGSINMPNQTALNNSTLAANTAYCDAACAVVKAYVDSKFATNTPSVDGTTIPSATSLIDNNLTVWTVSGGVIAKNGVPDTITSAVILMLWYKGVIYQENSANNWYSWLGTSWSTMIASGDPRVTTGTPLAMPFYGVNCHYVQGGVYSSIPIATQAALIKSTGAKVARQDMYSVADSATMKNTVVAQFSAAGVVTSPCIIPDLVAGSPTAAQLYTSCFTMGAGVASNLAGLVPFCEIGNEYDIEAMTDAGTINSTDGNLVTQYAQATMAKAMAAMRGIIDGWRSVDATTPLAVNCTYIHFAFVTMMVNGTLPNGAAAPNGAIPFDILTWHHYSTGGDMDSVFGLSGTYNVFNGIEALTSKPYYFSETGAGDPTIANSGVVTWMNHNFPLMVARPKCMGLSYYELYNFENGSSPGYGLYSLSGTTPTIKTVGTAYKNFSAANPK